MRAWIRGHEPSRLRDWWSEHWEPVVFILIVVSFVAGFVFMVAYGLQSAYQRKLPALVDTYTDISDISPFGLLQESCYKIDVTYRKHHVHVSYFCTRRLLW